MRKVTLVFGWMAAGMLLTTVPAGAQVTPGPSPTPTPSRPIVPGTSITPKKGEVLRKLAPAPCASTRLTGVDVVRNNRPDQTFTGVPTYRAKLTRSGLSWTAAVPAEAYDLTAPYLVRMNFQSDDVLDAYHEALTVLTKQQVEALHWISSGTTTVNLTRCFLKVTTPASRLVASMQMWDVRMRQVTDDFPADVTNGGQYKVEIWYFAQGTGVFAKQGEGTVTLGTCPPASTSRFVCQ